jgi:hypothetical protein
MKEIHDDPNRLLSEKIDLFSNNKTLTDRMLQEQSEARAAQNRAANVVIDASDRVPQFTGTTYGPHKGPDKHVHSPEDSARISLGQTLDGPAKGSKGVDGEKSTVAAGANYPTKTSGKYKA